MKFFCYVSFTRDLGKAGKDPNQGSFQEGKCQSMGLGLDLDQRSSFQLSRHSCDESNSDHSESFIHMKY